MSVFTLSNTAATYLFYQHREYISFDERLRKRYRGLNDPPLINTLICTLLYVMITAPRIWSNALALSITPILSLIMFILESFVMLYVSHRLATPLNQNAYFPSGIVTGVINFLCPCTPVQNLGLINLFSTLLIVLKVILLYPITIFNVLPVNDNFDRFRCFTTNETINFPNETKYRACEENETQTQLLFKIVLPLTITSLLIMSIPFGFLIPKLMTRAKLTSLNKNITAITQKIKACFSNLSECLMCCCEKSKDVEAQSKSDQQTSEIDEEVENESLIATNDLELKQPSNDWSKSTPHDVEDQLIKNESQQATAMGNLLSFVLNIRAIFDELQNQNKDCKYS